VTPIPDELRADIRSVCTACSMGRHAKCDGEARTHDGMSVEVVACVCASCHHQPWAEILARNIVERLSYKPGWSFLVERRPMPHEGTQAEPSTLWLTAYCDDTDSRTGAPRVYPDGRHTWCMAWPGVITSEAAVLAWVRKAIHEWEVHEANKWLRLDGELVHDPHQCVQCLIGGCRA
jgi:hypothetical protein